MSEQNIEIVRRGYEAYNRGDLDDMVADHAPTFEYVASRVVPGSRGLYRGPEGWEGMGLGWLRNEFESPRVEIRELTEAGDRVVAGLTVRGRGKQSGVEVSWDLWHVWIVRDRKIVHGQGFTDRDDALKAAGLSE
jgi:ketosteroid isomerase-like protein